MTMPVAVLAGSAIVSMVAAPGEPPVAERDVPDVAKAAVLRRLDADVMPGFRGLVVNPSAQMPGYVVCGEVGVAKAGAFERFFVVVPGSSAVLERDGNALIRIRHLWARVG
jgi:hypothetical protein